jgi:aspartyl-tRNA(Asn)/glutamyl-tRNA(Gln) amidotransferase subunit A
LALVLQTIADPPQSDLVSALDRPLSRPPVLGRARGLFDRLADDSVREMMDVVCRQLCSQGATILDVALPASFDEVLARHRVVMGVEAAAYHKDRLGSHPDDYGPCITSLLEQGLNYSAVEYAQAKELQSRIREEMSALLQNIDALICPATTRSAPTLETTGDPAFNSPWSFTGSPVVSVPTARTSDGLPLAVQLIGRMGDEAELFWAASWCESKRKEDIGEPPWPL